jgi:hypothetical protein
MHTGSCLCRGIAFEVDGPLAAIQICHCSQCRKAQGTAFASNIPVESGAFRLLRGEELLMAYESSPGKERLFCRRCGSPVFSRRRDKPGVLRIRAGLFDAAIPTRAGFHAHTASGANWWPPPDDLPTYAETAKTA